jgi:hypothetical protein
MTTKQFCPFCNIKMYIVLDNDYPGLDTFLCYKCGFNYDLILAEQKSLFQQYQKLFIHTKEKGIDISLKNYSPTENKQYFPSTTEFQQRNKTPNDSTEPYFVIFAF